MTPRTLLTLGLGLGVGALFLFGGGEAKAAQTDSPPVPPPPVPPNPPLGTPPFTPPDTTLPGTTSPGIPSNDVDPISGLRFRPVAGNPSPWHFAEKYSGNGARWKELITVNPNLVVKKFASSTKKDDKGNPVMYEGIFEKDGSAWGSPTFAEKILIPADWKG